MPCRIQRCLVQRIKRRLETIVEMGTEKLTNYEDARAEAALEVTWPDALIYTDEAME